MSRNSRRKKRQARAKRVGHGRGRGRKSIWLNPPGVSPDEILRRFLCCLPKDVKIGESHILYGDI